MRKRISPIMRSHARRLRREATDAERRLWWALRTLKPLGYHFRRQVPFGPYILDFAEHSRRLVIEVDGGQHSYARNRLRDERRDAALRAEGYTVLRVWNSDVITNIAGVIDLVLYLSPPTRLAARATLPTEGEGK